MTFTPGPWRVAFDTRIEYEPFVAGYGFAVAKVFCDPVETGIADEWKANARLIAAAPDLLAAVEQVNALVRKAQDVLSLYLQPDGDADEAIEALLVLLDGPEQREIRTRSFEAVAKARGTNGTDRLAGGRPDPDRLVLVVGPEDR